VRSLDRSNDDVVVRFDPFGLSSLTVCPSLTVLGRVRDLFALPAGGLPICAGMYRTYPSLLERGLRNPTLFEILKLFVALEQRPSLLIDLTAPQLVRERDR